MVSVAHPIFHSLLFVDEWFDEKKGVVGGAII
jgi:hypothetical protein